MLNFITALIRPENLEIILQSITDTIKCDWRWYTVGDLKVNSSIINKIHPNQIIMYAPEKHDHYLDCGNTPRNIALDSIKDGWVYILDDDTVLHPNFFNCFTRGIKYYPGSAGYTFFCAYPDGTIRNIPPQHSYNHIDTGCFIFRREVIGNTRFDVNNRNAESSFYKEIYCKYSPYIIHITDVGAYLNFLKIPQDILDFQK